jgi:heptosyltransferase II
MAIKNVIIKSSYSALENGITKSNLGDLLRVTVLLESIEGSYVWLTNEPGLAILKNFMEPENIIITEEFEEFFPKIDKEAIIYNLDNHDLHLEQLRCFSGKVLGYFPDSSGIMKAENSKIASLQPYSFVTEKDSFQSALIQGTGGKWQEQDYSRFTGEQKIKYDIGLNNHVHHDWTSKCWPGENWQNLAKKLADKYSISWQQGLNNIDEYIEWVASCRVIITQDTLGLHLASALRKKIIAIIGPTENREFSYNRVTIIKPEPRDCMPCHAPVCIKNNGEKCLSEISVEDVSAMVSLLNNYKKGLENF